MILYFTNGKTKVIENEIIIEKYIDWLEWNFEYNNYTNFINFLFESGYNPNRVQNIYQIYKEIENELLKM